jgi:hypothetical protein
MATDPLGFSDRPILRTINAGNRAARPDSAKLAASTIDTRRH